MWCVSVVVRGAVFVVCCLFGACCLLCVGRCCVLAGVCWSVLGVCCLSVVVWRWLMFVVVCDWVCDV